MLKILVKNSADIFSKDLEGETFFFGSYGGGRREEGEGRRGGRREEGGGRRGGRREERRREEGTGERRTDGDRG
jgi:hypothetical protein